MKSLRIVVLLSALMAILSLECKNDGVSVANRPNGLYGRVIDANGSALVGVNVHYIFYTSTNPVITSVWLQYSLPTSQVVTLKIFDPFDREVSTLINTQQQPAGQHSILFDSTVTNGVYSYRLQTGDSIRTGSFFIRDDDIARLQQKSPLTISDHSGQYFLSAAVLGIGRTFQGEVVNETIGDSLSLVLTKTSYQTYIQNFRLDTTIATDKTFTLISN